MSRFRSLPGVTTVSLLALSLGCTATDDVDGEESATLDRLVERNVAAMGGAEALDSLRNIDVRFEVIEPAFTARGRYRAVSDGRMRVDVFIDGSHVFSEGIDESGPWQQPGPGAPLETVYTSYEELCGTLRATRSVRIDMRTGDTVQATRTLAQKCNRPTGALGLPRDAPARLRLESSSRALDADRGRKQRLSGRFPFRRIDPEGGITTSSR